MQFTGFLVFTIGNAGRAGFGFIFDKWPFSGAGSPSQTTGARSAPRGAAGVPSGGQQVREIKRHFRFRGFATKINIEIRYKSTWPSRLGESARQDGEIVATAPRRSLSFCTRVCAEVHDVDVRSACVYRSYYNPRDSTIR